MFLQCSPGKSVMISAALTNKMNLNLYSLRYSDFVMPRQRYAEQQKEIEELLWLIQQGKLIEEPKKW